METIGLRRLNRASLRRQSLLARTEDRAVAEVARLGGLQAQAPNAPYVGLWSRVAGFRTGDVADALLDRALVRLPLLRGTLHLTTAADALAWYPLVRPVLERGFEANFRRRLPGVDVPRLVEDCAALLAEQPMSRAELGAALTERWPGVDRTAMAYAATCLLPVVQVPPRGVWGETAQATWTTVRAWLGTEPAAGRVEDLVLRYLAAFGPASARDLRTWCGLSRLREVAEGLRLPTYRDDDGTTLYDVPDGGLPDPDTPAPPRFLPEYDNLLLSYADRARVGADHRAVPLPPGIGGVSGSVLVDGFWQANWRLGDPGTLIVEPFGRLPGRDVAEVTEEGLRLVAFLAPDADRHEVVCTAT
jgi:hypothetical protein